MNNGEAHFVVLSLRLSTRSSPHDLFCDGYSNLLGCERGVVLCLGCTKLPVQLDKVAQ